MTSLIDEGKRWYITQLLAIERCADLRFDALRNVGYHHCQVDRVKADRYSC